MSEEGIPLLVYGKWYMWMSLCVNAIHLYCVSLSLLSASLWLVVTPLMSYSSNRWDLNTIHNITMTKYFVWTSQKYISSFIYKYSFLFLKCFPPLRYFFSIINNTKIVIHLKYIYHEYKYTFKCHFVLYT